MINPFKLPFHMLLVFTTFFACLAAVELTAFLTGLVCLRSFKLKYLSHPKVIITGFSSFNQNRWKRACHYLKLSKNGRGVTEQKKWLKMGQKLNILNSSPAVTAHAKGRSTGPGGGTLKGSNVLTPRVPSVPRHARWLILALFALSDN